MRLSSLVLFASLALGLAACSPNSQKDCSPSTCNGCCDSTGTCQAGNTPLACGVSGAVCGACQLGESCTFGQCKAAVGQGGGAGGGSGGGGGATGGGGGATGGGGMTGGGGGGMTGGGGGMSGGGGGSTGGGGGGMDAGVNPCAGTLSLCVDRCLDLQADPENCGRCGNVCGQGQVCNHGQCALLPDDCTSLSRGCGAGYYCDPVSKKCMGGCRLTSDCPMGGTCNAGTCACPAGQHACGQQCVPDDATSSCGARCSACAQPDNSTASCTSATCGFTCNTGFRLESGLCVDVDECASNNGGCSANARCTNTVGGRTCACNAGFTGDGVTCTDVNECATNNGGCSANATCTNTPGARTCTCNAGYTGDGTSCADVDECATNNGGCASTATCTNTPGARTCACNAGYTGNGLTCADVNECATNNGGCLATATCTNTPGSRTCACASGYTGDGVTSCTDVNECATNNGGCATNATCTNTPGSRTCACNSGFTGNGLTCTDVNECATNNGGCAATASGGVCTNTPGSRTCACATGWTGDGFTCADVNECATNNGGCAAASSGGVCTNTVGSRTCSCATGWTGNGLTCTDVNECATNNGGCSANATCTNTPGARTCACNAGYSGDGVTCADVNECLTNNGGCAPTSSGGVCTNTPGSRTCACATGWTGNGLTCTDVNECATNNGGCSTNATCTNTPGARTCACNAGYAGDGVTCNPNGDACSAPVVLTLNTVFSGSTAGAVNDVAGPLNALCGGDALAGPDTMHVFTPATTGVYRVAVTGFSGIVVWASSACGAPASCQAVQPGNGTNAAFTFRGTAGVPTYLMVDGYAAGNSGAYSLTITSVTPPANDTCATATALTLNTDVAGTVANSVNDVTPAASCNVGTYIQPEVVYSFTPTVTGQYVLRETTTADVVLWVAPTCDGVCTAAVDDPETLVATLTAGTPYFFFVEPYASATTFTLRLEPVVPPSNDTCASPAVLPVSTTVSATTFGGTNDYTGPLSAACGGATLDGNDVVYSFTPATSGNFQLSLTPSNAEAWLSPTCGAVASCTAITSAIGNDIVFRGTAGTTSFITVDRVAAGAVDFGLSVTPVTAPANDTCAAAQAITLGTPFTGTTVGAVDDVEPSMACGGGARAADVVYTFTPAVTGQYLVRETTSADVVFWLDSACDGTCVGAVQDEPEELVATLTAGVPVFLVVEPYSSRQSFTFEVTLAVPPANDTCSAPQALTLGTPVNTTTTLATNDYNGPLSAACGGLTATGRDVVYSYTPASSGNVSITIAASGWTPTVWASTVCGQAASCFNAQAGSSQVIRATAGTPVFITVDNATTNAGSYTLTLNAVTGPANDTCATATPLSVGVPVSGTTVGAVNDAHPTCVAPGGRNGEVVYSFTPPTSGSWVFHETTASDVVMFVSTVCDGTCIAGTDEPEDLAVTLTAGTTYYLFVEPWSSPGPININVNTN
ncbi:MAG: EGF domain-containing protein [Myxococcota bacterium]